MTETYKEKQARRMEEAAQYMEEWGTKIGTWTFEVAWDVEGVFLAFDPQRGHDGPVGAGDTVEEAIACCVAVALINEVGEENLPTWAQQLVLGEWS